MKVQFLKQEEIDGFHNGLYYAAADPVAGCHTGTVFS
jgi:hypothetical protein